MKKRNLKFALLLKDGRPVRSLGELKSYYDIDKIINYYNNGQLERWLEQNNYLEQLKNVQKLKAEIKYKLVETLDNILLRERENINEVSTIIDKNKLKNSENLISEKENINTIKEKQTQKNVEVNHIKDKKTEKILPKVDLINTSLKMDNLQEQRIEKNINDNCKKDFSQDRGTGDISKVLKEIGLKTNDSNSLQEISLKNSNNNKNVKIQNSTIVNMDELESRRKMNCIEENKSDINNKSFGKNSKLSIGNNISKDKSVKESIKASFGLGSTETLFKNAISVNNSSLNKDKYSESDVMANREMLLKPKKKSILSELNDKKTLNRKNNVLGNNLSKDKGLNIQFKNINDKTESKKIQNDGNLIIDTAKKDVYEEINIDNVCKSNEPEMLEEAIRDPEFEKISEIVTDPKSLKMLKDFYLKNKQNIKNTSNIKTNIEDIQNNNIQGNLSLKVESKPIVENEFIVEQEDNKKEEEKVISKNIKESEFTIYSQRDYEDILNIRESSNTHLKLYIEFNGLEVNRELENVQYVGTNKQVIYLDAYSCFDAIKKDISFENLKISSKKEVTFVCNSMKGCTIDRAKIKKGIQDLVIKYPSIMVKEMECLALKEEDIEGTGSEKGKSVEAFIEKVFSYGGNEQEILATARYEGLVIYTNVVMGMVDMAFLKDEKGEIHNISRIFTNMENIDIFRKSPDIGIKFVALLRQEDLLTIEKRTNKKYKNSKQALQDIFTGNDAESYLPYVMLMPVKILKSNEDLPRIDQIKLIEIMNLDTGIPYISRNFSGDVEKVKGDIYEFIRTISSSKEFNGINFNGVILEPTNDDMRHIEEIPVEAIYEFKNELYNTKVTDIKFLLNNDKKMVAYVEVEDIVAQNKVIKIIKFEDADKFKQLRLNIGDNVTVSVSKNGISLNKDLKNKISKGIYIPLICPFCGENLNFREVGTFGRCENVNCKGNIASSIYTELVDMGIYNVTMDRIVSAHNKGFLNNIDDLVSLSSQNLVEILDVSVDKIEELKQNIKNRMKN